MSSEPSARDLRPQSIAVVVGTRPEIIKLAPVVHELGDAAFLVHTGQHIDEAMVESVLTAHGLPEPTAWLAAGGLSRAGQLVHIVQGLDRILAERDVDAVVVHGGTTSALAAALTANAHGVGLVNVEAGLRSFDRSVPEEHNRTVVDHLSDVVCAATVGNVENLLCEGVAAHRIALTGSTTVQSVHKHVGLPLAQLDVLDSFGLRPNGYVLATLHRPENTEDPDVLAAILGELAALPLPVVLPVHPRTQVAAAVAGCADLLDLLLTVPPQSSSVFLALAAHAAVVVSDSGGVQEECTVLKRPLVLVRRATERPEVLRDFATLVQPGPAIGDEVRSLLKGHQARLDGLRAVPSPFGGHQAGAKVARAIRSFVARRQPVGVAEP